MGEILFPFVYWAQDEKNVFLRVDLRNADAPEVTIREKRLIFQAIGEGAKGRNQYNFAFDFFAPIDADESVYKLTARGVELTLKKLDRDGSSSGEKWWPRLTFNQQRYSWLKIDFDKWRDPDGEATTDEDVQDAESRRMREMMAEGGFDMKSYEEQQAKETYEQLRLDLEKEGKRPIFLKPAHLTKTYLLSYNGAMFFGYFIIFCQLVLGYARDGTDYFPNAWADVSSKMICCQVAQFFEIFHSLVGYVKTPWIAPFMQVFGRGLVLFTVLYPEPRLHDKPFIFYLFAVWSLIEIVRYPYYFFALLKKDVGLITWLRYTMWIPLYPLGFLCEGVIIIRALFYYDETGKFSFSMPNAMNLSFDFGLFLRFYLVFLFLPGMFFLLQHMRKQRLAKLYGGNSKRVGKVKTR